MSELEEQEFIAERLDNDDIIAPFSNRFNLSTAKLDHESAAVTRKKAPQLQLEILEDDDLLSQFKSNVTSRAIVVSEATYDQNMLWRIHDVYRTDGACRRAINTMVEFVIGRRRPTVVLDVNDYFDNEDDEQATLEEIQNNDLYRKYVRGISKINRTLNMHEFQKTILTNALVYGKGALLVMYDDDPIENDQAMPIAIKPLNSLRIGRVFYYEDDWSLAGIEYLDFRDKIIEANRLIYLVNNDHHISPRTLHQGISALEPVLDIAETNILNHQTNIKEINRRLWANFLIVKYMGKKKSDITKFKKSYKAGQPIISNRDFEAQVIDVKHDLEKLLDQMIKSDQKIARDVGVPQLLTGFDSEQAMATAGTVVHTFMNSIIESLRTGFRNVFESQWINLLIARIMRINGDTQESLTTPLKQQEDDLKLSTIPKDESIIVVEDLPFKIKFQFANIVIATLLDTAVTVLGLYKEGLLDLPLALEELDRKQYIPHMKIAAEERRQQQMELFGLQQQQRAANNPFNKQEPTPGQPSKDEPKMGADVSGRMENMMNNKLNPSSRVKKSSTGQNSQMRTI